MDIGHSRLRSASAEATPRGTMPALTAAEGARA